MGQLTSGSGGSRCTSWTPRHFTVRSILFWTKSCNMLQHVYSLYLYTQSVLSQPFCIHTLVIITSQLLDKSASSQRSRRQLSKNLRFSVEQIGTNQASKGLVPDGCQLFILGTRCNISILGELGRMKRCSKPTNSMENRRGSKNRPGIVLGTGYIKCVSRQPLPAYTNHGNKWQSMARRSWHGSFIHGFVISLRADVLPLEYDLASTDPGKNIHKLLPKYG